MKAAPTEKEQRNRKSQRPMVPNGIPAGHSATEEMKYSLEFGVKMKNDTENRLMETTQIICSS